MLGGCHGVKGSTVGLEALPRSQHGSGCVIQDYKNIEAGMYKLPWDMTTLRNKQYDPLHVLSTAATFASEASSTLRRRFQGAPEEVWLQSSMYPKYYLNTFHYQVSLLLTPHNPHFPPTHAVCLSACTLGTV